MYLLSIYPHGYRELTLAEDLDYADFDCLLWVGQSKKDTWVPPRLEWLEDDLSCDDGEIPDVASFAGQLLFSQKAYDSLKDVLGNQVEFLPTIGPTPDSAWYIVNVVNVVDIMDKSKSQYEIYSDGEIGQCTHALLNEPENDNLIFVVKGWLARFFVNEAGKRAIDAANLSGPLIREYLNP